MQKKLFLYFFKGLGVRDWSQGLLQALKFIFPSKMRDLDAYLPSYVTFRPFCQVWKVANPFLLIWEPLFMIFRPGRVLCLDFLLNFQAAIKLAASAASPKNKIQESRGASGRRLGWRTTETARLPWIPGFWSSGRLR